MPGTTLLSISKRSDSAPALQSLIAIASLRLKDCRSMHKGGQESHNYMFSQAGAPVEVAGQLGYKASSYLEGVYQLFGVP
jgi:hypothetical protein